MYCDSKKKPKKQKTLKKNAKFKRPRSNAPRLAVAKLARARVDKLVRLARNVRVVLDVLGRKTPEQDLDGHDIGECALGV
jgi:hypothetical protein